MDLSIKYVNHLGQSIAFGRYEDWHTIGTDLHDYEWSYDDSLGYISQLYHETKKKKLHLGMWCEDEARGIDRRNELVDITEQDVRAKKQGRLYVGDYYLECFVIGNEKGAWHFADHIMEATLTILAAKPVWWSETVHEFYPSHEVATGDYLDFEFDFDFDFTDTSSSQSVNNPSDHASYFQMIIYGYVSSPSVRIGTSTYRVDVEVPISGQLIIDSRARTIVVKDMYGNETNVYDKRIRGAVGSGQYIFEPIPEGMSAVSWPQSYGITLTLLRDASEPRWRAE